MHLERFRSRFGGASADLLWGWKEASAYIRAMQLTHVHCFVMMPELVPAFDTTVCFTRGREQRAVAAKPSYL